jgi:hypothetical protein
MEIGSRDWGENVARGSSSFMRKPVRHILLRNESSQFSPPRSVIGEIAHFEQGPGSSR